MTENKLDLDEVIRKAKKLMAFNNGNATEAEVQNATAILNNMLAKYQLSMADLEGGDSGEQVEEMEIDSRCRSMQSWQGCLIASLALGFGCKVIQGRKWVKAENVYRNHFTVIGHKSDTAIVEYLFSTLQKTLRQMGRKQGAEAGYSGGNLRAYVNAFVIGASNAIYNRLTAEKKGAESDSRALVVVKTKEVDAYVAGKYPHLSKGSGRVNYSNREGRVAGYKAGETVNLNRGVGNSAATKALK